MLEAKIADIFWTALLCWWITMNTEWSSMTESVAEILEETWNELSGCEWVGTVVDLTRDKMHALFAMLIRNRVLVYYPWTIGTAQDAALARLSPALMKEFDKFFNLNGRAGKWEELDPEVRRTFPLAANYDLLLQDATMRADLPSKLANIPRDSRVLIIPSIGWKGFYLENSKRFMVGKELVRTRAHRVDHVDNKLVVVIYLSFARRDSNVTVGEIYGIRDLLRNKYAPGWGEIISGLTGFREREGFIGVSKGILPWAIIEGRQTVEADITLLGAIGGKGAAKSVIDVDRDVDMEGATKGKDFVRRKRGWSLSRNLSREEERDRSYDTYISAEEGSPDRKEIRSKVGYSAYVSPL
ncbi:hypothetical protein C8J56DRAFT_879888 [Mycena floridula]|nr:hypothetical protein C8J56DRAFT_879888 [Mycena floridula]